MRRFLAAGFLTLLLLAPAAYPRSAYAFLGLGDIVHDPINAITLAANKLIDAGISSILSTFTDSIKIKEYVLDPLSWEVSSNILASLTGSVVDFVNGHGSGGSPLYVQNLSQYLGSVADNQALNFFAEIGRNSNSPFAAAIASSLRTNYLQSTSASGFWAANTCTLSQDSPDINAYLAGANFSQNGGWGTWFSLIEPQNNPYTLYYRTQSELDSRITTQQSQTSQQLAYNNGFKSFCDTSKSATQAALSPDAAKGAPQLGDPCQNPDGSTGVIATPGSVLAASLNKSVGSGVDKLVSADEFSEVMGQVVSGLLSETIGVDGGGLFGLSQGANSYTTQLRTQTAADAAKAATAAAQAQSSGSYQTAWQTIQNAAQGASSAAQAVVSCEQGGADPYGAQQALSQEIAPVLAQATAALANTAPQASDIATAQAQAQNTGAASSASSTSLIVSGGTLVDQMLLIEVAAGNALNACQSGAL